MVGLGSDFSAFFVDHQPELIIETLLEYSVRLIDHYVFFTDIVTSLVTKIGVIYISRSHILSF